MSERQVIHVSTCVMGDYDEPNGKWIVTTVLCDDGTMWRTSVDAHRASDWTRIANVPQHPTP